MQKKKNLHIYGTHLLNPYKTVVSHLRKLKKSFSDIPIYIMSDAKKQLCMIISCRLQSIEVIITYSGSSGGFVNAKKTQFTKIVKRINISKYLQEVKELWIFNRPLLALFCIPRSIFPSCFFFLYFLLYINFHFTLITTEKSISVWSGKLTCNDARSAKTIHNNAREACTEVNFISVFSQTTRTKFHVLLTIQAYSSISYSCFTLKLSAWVKLSVDVLPILHAVKKMEESRNPFDSASTFLKLQWVFVLCILIKRTAGCV